MPFTAFDTLALRGMIRHMSHKALRLYVTLSTYADRVGVCWPQAKELSETTGMHVETVLEALQELETMKLMVYRRRNERDPMTGRMLTNVYEVFGPLLKADSDSTGSSEHEPIRMSKFKTETTNEVTNDNNQFHQNHLQAPPPSTNEPRRKSEKQGPTASTMRSVVEQGEGQGKQPRKNSAAGTAPQNSKATLPPLPPLPRGFDRDAEMADEDDEVVARWMVSEAMIRRDGGEYRATLTVANARTYVARFGRLKCRAAVTLARRDPATKSLIGRADYLLRTSVSDEAQALADETARMTQDNAGFGD
jgi:hypothetical protein